MFDLELISPHDSLGMTHTDIMTDGQTEMIYFNFIWASRPTDGCIWHFSTSKRSATLI